MNCEVKGSAETAQAHLPTSADRRLQLPTVCSEEMPISPNKFKKGASSPRGVSHNASGELKGGNGAKKNGNGSKNGKGEKKKEDKMDLSTLSSSFEWGAGHSQSEFSAGTTESLEQPADMDMSEISLSSSFAASALPTTSSASDICLATSIGSPMMTEVSEETTPVCSLGMKRQLEEPIDAGFEVTSEMLDLMSEILTEAIPESERSAEEARLVDI